MFKSIVILGLVAAVTAAVDPSTNVQQISFGSVDSYTAPFTGVLLPAKSASADGLPSYELKSVVNGVPVDETDYYKFSCRVIENYSLTSGKAPFLCSNIILEKETPAGIAKQMVFLLSSDSLALAPFAKMINLLFGKSSYHSFFSTHGSFGADHAGLVKVQDLKREYDGYKVVFGAAPFDSYLNYAPVAPGSRITRDTYSTELKNVSPAEYESFEASDYPATGATDFTDVKAQKPEYAGPDMGLYSPVENTGLNYDKASPSYSPAGATNTYSPAPAAYAPAPAAPTTYVPVSYAPASYAPAPDTPASYAPAPASSIVYVPVSYSPASKSPSNIPAAAPAPAPYTPSASPSVGYAPEPSAPAPSSYEYAPVVYVPYAYAPAAYAPAGSPAPYTPTTSYSPAASAPAGPAPSMSTPTAYTPSAYAPAASAPPTYTPSAYAPAGSAPAPAPYDPSNYAPAATAPDASAPNAYTPVSYAPAAPAPSAANPGGYYTKA